MSNYSQYILSPLLSTILTSTTSLEPLHLRAIHVARLSSSANMVLYRRPLIYLFIYFYLFIYLFIYLYIYLFIYLKHSNGLQSIMNFSRSTLYPDQAQDHHLSSSTFLICAPVKLYLLIITFHFQLEIINTVNSWLAAGNDFVLSSLRVPLDLLIKLHQTTFLIYLLIIYLDHILK